MNRRAFSLIEVVLAIGVLSMAIAAMVQSFGGGYRAIYRSQYASMAAQVARETLEELEQMAAAPSGQWLFRQAVWDPTGAEVHPQGGARFESAALALQSWRQPSPVAGPLFAITGAIFDPEGAGAVAASAVRGLVQEPSLSYPAAGYDRLRRRILFTSYRDTGEEDVLRVRVEVTWQEFGDQVEAPAGAVFETLVVRDDTSRVPR